MSVPSLGVLAAQHHPKDQSFSAPPILSGDQEATMIIKAAMGRFRMNLLATSGLNPGTWNNTIAEDVY